MNIVECRSKRDHDDHCLVNLYSSLYKYKTYYTYSSRNPVPFFPITREVQTTFHFTSPSSTFCPHISSAFPPRPIPLPLFFFPCFLAFSFCRLCATTLGSLECRSTYCSVNFFAAAPSVAALTLRCFFLSSGSLLRAGSLLL
jgi:hypothetical protein